MIRASRVISAEPPDKRSHAAKKAVEKEYLLIDGYNIVFAWEELREMALRDIMAARDKLIDMLVDFAGFRKEHVILVFDAYKVRGGRGEVIHVGGIDVIYTKEAETADLYIEKAAHVRRGRAGDHLRRGRLPHVGAESSRRTASHQRDDAGAL